MTVIKLHTFSEGKAFRVQILVYK